jgi:hypothetical protein
MDGSTEEAEYVGLRKVAVVVVAVVGMLAALWDLVVKKERSLEVGLKWL